MVLRLIAKVSSIFLLDRCLVNKWKTRGKGGFQKRAHYFKFKMRKIVKKVLFLASKNRPKSLICSLQSFLRNFASIFAKLISQNCFLHFAKFRETRHSIFDTTSKKPKCVSGVVVFFQFLAVCLQFSASCLQHWNL